MQVGHAIHKAFQAADVSIAADEYLVLTALRAYGFLRWVVRTEGKNLGSLSLSPGSACNCHPTMVLYPSTEAATAAATAIASTGATAAAGGGGCSSGGVGGGGGGGESTSQAIAAAVAAAVAAAAGGGGCDGSKGKRGGSSSSSGSEQKQLGQGRGRGSGLITQKGGGKGGGGKHNGGKAAVTADGGGCDRWEDLLTSSREDKHPVTFRELNTKEACEVGVGVSVFGHWACGSGPGISLEGLRLGGLLLVSQEVLWDLQCSIIYFGRCAVNKQLLWH